MRKLFIVMAIGLVPITAFGVVLDDFNIPDPSPPSGHTTAMGWGVWLTGAGILAVYNGGGQGVPHDPQSGTTGGYQEIIGNAYSLGNVGGVVKVYPAINQVYDLGISVTGALTGSSWFEVHHEDGDVSGNIATLDGDGNGWVKFDAWGLGLGPGSGWANHGTTPWLDPGPPVNYTVQQAATNFETTIAVTAGQFTVWTKQGSVSGASEVMGIDWLASSPATPVENWMIY
jgi:hypothetical protein